MRTSVLLISLVLLTMVAPCLYAQGPGPGKEASAKQSSTPGRTDLTLLQNRQERLGTEIAGLRERIETLSTTMSMMLTVVSVAFVVMGALLGLGWFGSFMAWRRAEARTSEAHTLAMTGERAAQGRSEQVHDTFLASSKNTLDLVNATLTLAKEASERAARSIEEKAKTTLVQLDHNAKALIASVPAENDRALVADPKRRSKLRSLAHKISGFETNRFVLPTELALTPHCLFLRGMDFHLDQQFDDAFECWNEVALRDDTPASLKSLAWYWTGYERNNLGEFELAIQGFGNALDHAAGARRYELQRIKLESQFFNKAREAAADLVQPLESLLRAIDNDRGGEQLAPRRTKILTTLGNVQFQVGNEHARDSRQPEARKAYESARKYFKAADEDKWALFGFAQTCCELGDNEDEARAILLEKVRPEMREEYVNREEPRTKVLARSTELICCTLVPALRSKIAVIHSQVIDALGQVDQRLTVYSQMQRRNVTKAEFGKDLEGLLAEAEATA